MVMVMVMEQTRLSALIRKPLVQLAFVAICFLYFSSSSSTGVPSWTAGLRQHGHGNGNGNGNDHGVPNTATAIGAGPGPGGGGIAITATGLSTSKGNYHLVDEQDALAAKEAQEVLDDRARRLEEVMKAGEGVGKAKEKDKDKDKDKASTGSSFISSSGSGTASGSASSSGSRVLHVAIEERAGHVSNSNSSASPRDNYDENYLTIASSFEQHNEVWPAFLHAITQLSNVKSSVYLVGGPDRIGRHGMGRIVANLNEDVEISDWDIMLQDLKIERASSGSVETEQKKNNKKKKRNLTGNQEVEEKEEEEKEEEEEESRDPIDVIFSTTCFNTLQDQGQNLLTIYDARSVSNKFRIACVLHHTSPRDLDQIHELLKPWVERDALVLVGLSDHTTRSIRHSLDDLGWKWRFQEDVSFSGVPARTIVPIFPLPKGILATAASAASSAKELKQENQKKRPASAVIQGSITHFRRDYGAIFASLESAIRADPHLWGYTLPTTSSALLPLPPKHNKKPTVPLPPPITEEELKDMPFLPDPSVKDSFKLILLGQMQDTPDLFPKSLEKVIQIVSDVAYPEYYSTLNKAGLLIPAFKGQDYYSEL